VRGPAGTAALAAVAAYAWWAAGLPPFTAASYTAVALPVAALALAACLLPTPARTPRAGGRPWYGPLPWAVLLVAVLSLEAAGLALGGRSSTVPTLSTVVDHALAWHGVRFVLFLAWLALGWAPVLHRLSWQRPGT
jgi:hypothetical protein